MKMLDFSKSSPESLQRLSEIEERIDNFSKAHKNPKKLTNEERNEIHLLLKERAAALSDTLGVKISPVVDD